jgi:ligand-binding SRPBCC domain-containing protein
MPTIRMETRVDADRQRLFDLARSVDTHTETTGNDERAVAGTTSGLLEAGDTVTWRDRHFGIPMELTVAITEMDAPEHFRDELVDGPFAELVHDHHFERVDGHTVMRDEFVFASPAGPLGTAVDRLVLEQYLRNLIASRNRELKAIAENGSA